MHRTGKELEVETQLELLDKITGIVVDTSNITDVPARYIKSYRAAWIGHQVMKALIKADAIKPGKDEEQMTLEEIMDAPEANDAAV